MKEAFVNIVLVCLDGNFCKFISKELSDKLDMFFADLKDYIEYDLLDSKAILEKCGVEYFEEREFKATRAFGKFENSVLTVDFDLFKKNRSAFEDSSMIVYLRLPQKLIDKNETINLLAFETHDEYLHCQSNIVIDLKTKAKTKAIKEIMLKLGEAL